MSRCVVYVSTVQPGISRGEIDAIVAASQRNNAADGISGLLLFNGSNFLQMVEGPSDPLGRLMRRLYADPRHDALVKLIDRAIEQRACASWAMQPIAIGLPQRERAAAVSATLPAGLPEDVRALITNFAQLN